MRLAQLNPFNWGRGKAYDDQRFPDTQTAVRQRQAENPYASMFEDWVAREVNPHLYEAIREAMGPVDGAINRLTTMDGIIRVEAESDRLQNAIEDFMDNVPVNDMQNSLQTFYSLQSNEMYEQGCTIGEFVLEAGGKGVARLRVADSKGIYFKRADGVLETWYRPPAKRTGRRDGTDQVERVLRNSYAQAVNILSDLPGNGYRRLDPQALVYAGYNNEADGPYGVSIMRSTEFDARVLLTMKNALHNVWDRFGDPSFAVNLKARNKTSGGDTTESKRKKLADNLAEVLRIKKSGNSADFVNVIGPNDELEIKILGGDGEVLEIETPARFILEQLVAKTGLPPWMLGFHWSTAERLAQRQGELVLQESKTRYTHRRQGLQRIVSADLRGKRHTWKQGDWELVQELPSLQDLLAEAQAGFLNAQRDMMLNGEGANNEAPKLAKVTNKGGVLLPTDEKYNQADPVAMIDLRDPGAVDDLMRIAGEVRKGPGTRAGFHAEKAACDHKHHKAETYVEDADALMRLESAATRGLQTAWADLADNLIEVLELNKAKAAKAPEPVFIFDQAMLGLLTDLQEHFVASAGAEDAALAKSIYNAWLRGVDNGSNELGADEVEAAVREHMRSAMATVGMEQVKDTTIRAFEEDIVKQLAQGAYDGQNNLDVARALKARFDIHDYDWERLARSEIATAQGKGKIAQYAAHGLAEYDWIRAGGACPICVGLEQGSPYPVPHGPLPSKDSHPNCRCTVGAVIPK